jgi:hypothetical protein
MSVGLCLLVGSRLWEIEYVYTHYGPDRVSPVSMLVPMIFIAVWAMQFHYMRHWARTMAIAVIAHFLGLLPLRTDNFALATYLGQLIVLTSSVTLYAKMKHPAFARIEPNPTLQRTPGSGSVSNSGAGGPAPLS